MRVIKYMILGLLLLGLIPVAWAVVFSHNSANGPIGP
jgi:hypothetical protein